MFEFICIVGALVFGLGAKQLGFPPLIGYLISGVLLYANADVVGLTSEKVDVINSIAHIGVLLLLFTVGLKLNVKKIIKKEVIGTGTLHMLFSVLFFFPVIHYFFETSVVVALSIAIALSFSSTVLAAKSLDEKNELKSFHGRIAIGILVVQDLIALIFMSIASGETPSVWALSILFLPLLRPIIFTILNSSGHDDLLVLMSIVVAVILGGYGFEHIGLSSELGALVMGALIAGHPKSVEISEKLWGIKELFLIAFFVSIGLKGMPSSSDWLFASVMTIMLPLQTIVFFALLVLFRLKARTSFLTSVSLTSFSEFALIVAAIIMPEWIVPLALCVTLSFLLASPINRFSHQIFDRYEKWFNLCEIQIKHEDDELNSAGNAEVLILGMGRVGYSAYNTLLDAGKNVLGIDSDLIRVTELKEKGINVEFADVEHSSFWTSIKMNRVKSCIVSTSDHESGLFAIRKLRDNGFSGYIVSHSLHSDHMQELSDAGANETFLTMAEAGAGLASHVLKLPKIKA